MKTNHMKKILFTSLLLGLLFMNAGLIHAASAPKGIYGNGTGGITINVNAAPYTTFAGYSYGQYAYTSSGCAWFASARVHQLTGKGNTIRAGKNWYNSGYSALGFSRGTAMKAPAIVCWQGHVAILEKISGNTAYISEGGCNGYGTGASYGYTIIRAVNKSALTSQNSGFIGYVYLPSAPEDRTKPTIRNVKVSNITTSSYKVTCTVSDNVGVTKVLFPSWNTDKHTGNDAVWLTGKISGNTASVTVNLKNLKSGVVEGHYMTHVYAYDAAGNSQGKAANGVFIDRSAPTLVSSSVSVDDTGYWVKCQVKDKSGIAKVEFPTWTLKNDQDDLKWADGTLVNGEYQFRVNISEHNNEYGTYVTHIYATDIYGNKKCVATHNKITVSKKSETPPVADSGNTTGNTTGNTVENTAENTTENNNSVIQKPSVLSAPVFSSLTNIKTKSARLTFTAVGAAGGYQIQYATNRLFLNAKNKTVTKTTVTVNSLKKKKTYYFRVRAYKKNGTKKSYGKWSKVKKVKITK